MDDLYVGPLGQRTRVKLTDQPLPTLVLSLVGQVKGEKCGGLVRSLGYVAMMDGRRTSARVARERGQRDRERE